MWNAVKLKSMIYFLRNCYDLYCFQVCCCRSKIRWGCFDENHGSFKDLDVNSSWTFDNQWGSLWNPSEYMSNLLWDQTQVGILCFKFSLTRGTDTKMTKAEQFPKLQFLKDKIDQNTIFSQLPSAKKGYSCITLQVT